MLRLLLAGLALATAGSAVADTPEPVVIPKESQEPPLALPKQPGTPSFGGGTSAGIVVTPPDHPDARPWPRGILIVPPDVGDNMVIAPGGSGLSQQGWSARSYTGEITQRFADGLSKLFQLVVPKQL